MWYFIIGAIVAICVFILFKAYNKSFSRDIDLIEPLGIWFMSTLSIFIWPITILIGIGILLYHKFLKEKLDKLTDWLSEKLFE